MLKSIQNCFADLFEVGISLIFAAALQYQGNYLSQLSEPRDTGMQYKCTRPILQQGPGKFIPFGSVIIICHLFDVHSKWRNFTIVHICWPRSLVQRTNVALF
jgi:hypothetical protein